ncbi:hypothetical protein DI09_6p150 [Mitosporidium daphniae]|uniref:Uncharacterized protein n=1 Tax=Mitosporidium daphniae TaxID=1485682 RepID=A0A098VM21_9MICR|nr:uncharacterized protein DI09_86p110 [Mitosporidium daphniae]XP_013236858.1 uncharacterized protein DI09_6p150 [Mitosporidium daphniae]KGG50147.1 hypothetical protein DI09_86p110 [Mitosporidium daphniae]KGG50431.1 hypothetical protein DI09_6p150 [Mitosporidium daphniae]|eukprot:XP_013236574.1 uncharacterized protein DI09_86p110 [Mitosporidium daphniae]
MSIGKNGLPQFGNAYPHAGDLDLAPKRKDAMNNLDLSHMEKFNAFISAMEIANSPSQSANNVQAYESLHLELERAMDVATNSYHNELQAIASKFSSISNNIVDNLAQIGPISKSLESLNLDGVPTCLDVISNPQAQIDANDVNASIHLLDAQIQANKPLHQRSV